MKFYMPTVVYDEPECVKAHAFELASLGKKALIVTGKNSASRCGALSDVTKALWDNDTPYCIFSEVEENPSVETVLRAAAFGKANNADFVVGIGGGSPMDAAKAAAFLMKQDSPEAEMLYDSNFPSSHLPVAEVPTTCGTGSEVTGVSVLTRHQKRMKKSIPHRIFPALALIDGKYLYSAPHSMIVNTAVDALAHLVESYLVKASNDYSRAAVMEGLHVWSRSKEVLAGERKPEAEDCSNLMRASALAGIAISQTGTSLPHALSYILTYEMKMPHGMACGYFLPGFIAEADKKDRKAIAKAACFARPKEMYSFIRDVLSLDEIVVPDEILELAYRTVLADRKRLEGCLFDADETVLGRIAGRSTADGTHNNQL